MPIGRFHREGNRYEGIRGDSEETSRGLLPGIIRVRDHTIAIGIDVEIDADNPTNEVVGRLPTLTV